MNSIKKIILNSLILGLFCFANLGAMQQGMRRSSAVPKKIGTSLSQLEAQLQPIEQGKDPFKFVYLDSPRQRDGSSCGYYATFCASILTRPGTIENIKKELASKPNLNAEVAQWQGGDVRFRPSTSRMLEINQVEWLIDKIFEANKDSACVFANGDAEFKAIDNILRDFSRYSVQNQRADSQRICSKLLNGIINFNAHNINSFAFIFNNVACRVGATGHWIAFAIRREASGEINVYKTDSIGRWLREQDREIAQEIYNWFTNGQIADNAHAIKAWQDSQRNIVNSYYADPIKNHDVQPVQPQPIQQVERQQRAYNTPVIVPITTTTTTTTNSITADSITAEKNARAAQLRQEQIESEIKAQEEAARKAREDQEAADLEFALQLAIEEQKNTHRMRPVSPAKTAEPVTAVTPPARQRSIVPTRSTAMANAAISRLAAKKNKKVTRNK